MSCSCHPSEPSAHPRGGISRRTLVAAGLAAGFVPLVPGLAGVARASTDDLSGSAEGTDPSPTAFGGGGAKDFGFLPPRPKTEQHVRPMMFPVLPDANLGKATWTDTYLAPRSGGRLHEGQDLMGNKMLKLLAVTNGTIIELRHQSGGNSLYLKGDDDWYYCYLHINNDDPGTDNGANQFKYAFAPGMAVGKRVLKGEHIAYLGDSGNAESTGAHCHFEIRMPNAKWYNAAAVNAKYSLDAAEPAKVRTKVAAAAFAPLPSSTAFAVQQAGDFLGAVPAEPWLSRSVEDLDSGTVGLDAFIEYMMLQRSHVATTQPLIRLYLAFFRRIPDYAGLDYWIRKCRAGTPIATAANQFADGPEFRATYGELDNAGFVDRVYRNLFDRAPDAGGADYWTRRLDGGSTRGWVMTQLSESSEYKTRTRSQLRVISIYAAMVRRSPDAGGYAYWVGSDQANGAALRSLISSFRTGTEYANRF